MGRCTMKIQNPIFFRNFWDNLTGTNIIYFTVNFEKLYIFTLVNNIQVLEKNPSKFYLYFTEMRSKYKLSKRTFHSTNYNF